MRGLIVLAWLVAAALLSAAPAQAHGGPQHAVTTASPPKAMQAAATRGDVDAEPASAAKGAHEHEHEADHNPLDHEHPFDDDPLHQMMAHFNLDFAAQIDATPARLSSFVRFAIPHADDASTGIAILPPVPPPLG